MKYIVTTDKSVQQAVTDLKQAVTDHKFGVLHTYDIKQTLNNKGVDFNRECHILEVCNPIKAKEVMEIDMSMNTALPCRISVYQDEGQTKIGMIPPKALLAFLSDDERLTIIAEEVEQLMIKMIEQAK